MMVSWAISRFMIACWTKAFTPGVVEDFPSLMCCISMGMYQQLSWKGVNPVELFMLELSANSIIGSFAIQNFWSDCTVAHSICTTFLIVLSKAHNLSANGMQSIWGALLQAYDAVHARTLVWTYVASWLETIVSGNPCSHTTSYMNLQASSDTLIINLMDTKCTIDVRWHRTTQR